MARSSTPPAPVEASALERTTPSRWTPLLWAGGTAGLTLALHLRDPHESGTWGYCPWLLLTGGYCPGCGALRAVNDLSHGDLLGAASSNLLFVLAIPFVVWAWARWARASWQSTRTAPGWVGTHPRAAVGLTVAVLLVFTVLRNLPGSWLAP